MIFVCNRTPYNQNSTVGHIFTHVIQTTGISSLVAYLCAITTTYFGVCSYFEALFIDLGFQYGQIDVEFVRRKNAAEMKKQFIELIELHNTILG